MAGDSELKSEVQGFSDTFRLQLTGKTDPKIIIDLEKRGINEIVELHDFVPHREATKLMFEAAMLLFIIPQSENNRLILTGKLFEYIASTTPMLSIGPLDGDAAKIIDEAGREAMIDYTNMQGIKDKLKLAYTQWVNNNNVLPKIEGTGHLQFSRQSLTGKLSEVLNEISQ